MNERHLFRGKRVDNKEWVEGHRVSDCLIRCIDTEREVFKSVNTSTICAFHGRVFQIDPTTIGQCSGHPDKLGRLIFEGDILFDGIRKYLAYYSPTSTGLQCREIGNGGGIWSLFHLAKGGNQGRRVEVIGNIHNNPELLAEGMAE